MKKALVIVAKEPIPGRVKTRLFPQLNAQEAAILYSLFVQDMVDEMAKLDTHEISLAYTPHEAKETFTKLLSHHVTLFPQEGEGLGERLTAAFEKMFLEGYEQVHIINSDSPDLPRSLVKRAADLLTGAKTDVVLGPCSDGGYYLVGLKKIAPELFRGISWSTDLVLKQTLEKASNLGLSWLLSEPWYDIDTYSDIEYFFCRNRERTEETAKPGQRTLQYLKNCSKSFL